MGGPHLGNSIVDIAALRVVDDGAWIWILDIMCNIVIHEHNDVLVLHTSLSQYLICVAEISACHKNKNTLNPTSELKELSTWKNSPEDNFFIHFKEVSCIRLRLAKHTGMSASTMNRET
jgi:hypothetical protein